MRSLNTILRRIRLLVRLAKLVRSDSSQAVQIVQVKPGKDETLTDIQHAEPYGYTSRPHDGAEVLVLSLGGNSSHSIALQIGDRRYRLKGLEKGEAAIYTDQGDKVHIKRGGTIEVVASTKLEVSSPLATFSQDVQIAGDLDVTGNSTANDHISSGVSGKSHDHDINSGSSAPGPTAEPNA